MIIVEISQPGAGRGETLLKKFVVSSILVSREETGNFNLSAIHRGFVSWLIPVIQQRVGGVRISPEDGSISFVKDSQEVLLTANRIEISRAPSVAEAVEVLSWLRNLLRDGSRDQCWPQEFRAGGP